MSEPRPLLELTMSMLRDRCEVWQRILRLQDWDVQLEIVRQHVLSDGRLGECALGNNVRKARIRILDSRDIDGQDMMDHDEAWDWELTLVHELLHVHMHDVTPDGHKAGSPEQIANERAVDAISKSLVMLARGGRA